MNELFTKGLNNALDWTEAVIKKTALRLSGGAALAPSAKEVARPAPYASNTKADEKVHQLAFTFAVIALAAKLAAADGEIKQEEFMAFCVLFPMPQEEQPKIQRLFFMAYSDPNSYLHYARQIAGAFPDRHALKEDLLHRLCRLAEADGRVTISERRMLEEVRKILKVSQHIIEDSLRTVFDSSKPNDPFELLGVTPAISNEGLKQAYRRRIRELHPDRLVAQGYEQEDISHAQAELMAVNEAYLHLCRRRKIK